MSENTLLGCKGARYLSARGQRAEGRGQRAVPALCTLRKGLWTGVPLPVPLEVPVPCALRKGRDRDVAALPVLPRPLPAAKEALTDAAEDGADDEHDDGHGAEHVLG